MSDQHQSRPGGRTARVRADVLRAVDDLTTEQPLAQLTLAKVAERSGVHLGTLYRRWGTLDGLLLDAVAERLTTGSPIRDTGNLHADLEDYAHRVAEDLSGPDGQLLLRTLVAVRLGTKAQLPPALTRRYDEMQALLDRAHARGENPPTLQQVVDVLVAPQYTALLFGTTPTDPATLVDRLLKLHPDQ